MYKTKNFEITLPAGTATLITSPTIKCYLQIQVVNDSGGSLFYTYNADTAEGEVKEGDIFYNAVSKDDALLEDTIKMRSVAGATIKVEIQYWES